MHVINRQLPFDIRQPKYCEAECKENQSYYAVPLKKTPIPLNKLKKETFKRVFGYLERNYEIVMQY
jgi:hypothetical protein